MFLPISVVSSGVLLMMAESKRKCNSLSPLEFHQASFRKLLTVLAEHMEQEEVVKCCFIYQVPRERSSSALAALEYLLAVGVLSHSNIEPLVELLKDINRHDLISDRVEPFIKQRNEEQGINYMHSSLISCIHYHSCVYQIIGYLEGCLCE